MQMGEIKQGYHQKEKQKESIGYMKKEKKTYMLRKCEVTRNEIRMINGGIFELGEMKGL